MASTQETVREFAEKLRDEGHEPNEIVDALVVVGLNGALSLGGKDAVLRFLTKLADRVREGKPVSRAKH